MVLYGAVACERVVDDAGHLALDLNTASEEELRKLLHGIGVARARAIVAGRPFKSVEELITRGFVTKEHFQRIADRITVRTK